MTAFMWETEVQIAWQRIGVLLIEIMKEYARQCDERRTHAGY